MPARIRGACDTPENSKIFGYVMGLNGLGVIWFSIPAIGKLFSEQLSNLTAFDFIIPLLPVPYMVACIIWLLGVFQQRPKLRFVAMVFFGVILFCSIVSMIALPSEEFQNKGGSIMLMLVFAGFSLCSGIISHIQMRKIEPSFADDYW